MARTDGDVQPAEGKTTWLLVGLVALVFAAVPLWTLGRSASSRLPTLPADPVATLEAGQKIAYAAGDLKPGDGLVCQSGGLNVGALVPKSGHTSGARQVNANSTWTASITIRARDDGAVIVRCS